MESEIVDRNGTKKSISSLLNKKPVIFICWASWCKPCIEEVPYEKTLEEEFGSKIDFIYLSFDFAKPEWIAKSKELNIDHNSYLLTNNVKSDLAGHYKINSIPRYLIYDKDGKKIDEQKLRPSDKNFKLILEGIIK